MPKTGEKNSVPSSFTGLVATLLTGVSALFMGKRRKK
ncbi:LPXTG cell wall anchor domain-containing protein [Leuconostoc suionicum]